MQRHTKTLDSQADDVHLKVENKPLDVSECCSCHSNRPGSSTGHPSSSPFDEIQWIIRIRRTLEENDDDENQPSSIYEVPKPLLSSKPEAYIPQLIALGPYHHFREELHDMERQKIYAAKRTQSQLPSKKFEHLVDIFMKLEHRIRTHYYRYLRVSAETFAWMMAIDTCFLIEFLQTFAIDEGKNLDTFSSGPTSRLLDSQGGTLQQSMLLGDIVKLENQIPLFLLLRTLEHQFTSSEIADDVLSTLLIGFFKEISPIKIENPVQANARKNAHLLDYLYHMIVPTSCQTLEEHDECESDQERCSGFKKAGSCIATGSKAIAMGIVRASWRVLGCLPVLSEIRFVAEELNITPDRLNKRNLSQPLLEEITIPSVTELVSAGIKFAPTNGDISTVEFNEKTATIHLPTIELDFNTEVVLRNLVAYEASLSSRPLVIARYIDLMNGIIDTADDAKLLSKSGVILNHLKTDEEVAELWNGMTRSVRLTRVVALDKAIEGVNNYYNNRWKLKLRRCMRRSCFFSWKFLLFLAIILILVVMSMQMYCMTNGCALQKHFQ